MSNTLKSLVLLLVLSLSWAQEPIIRIKQTGEYSLPKTWWRESETFQLQTYLEDDINNPE